jgi:4-hydroxy-2-oxoheptanedioate aldolase
VEPYPIENTNHPQKPATCGALEVIMIRTNRTKAKLRAGELCVGATIPLPSPDLVELAAAVGFDFVTIDVEHEAIDDGMVVSMIRAAEAYDVTPIVRTARDSDRILRYLNAGAQGIHVPRCNSAADAREIVEACRFHPEGKRTFWALGRSASWAMISSDEEWSQAANRELLVVAMVEEVEGLRNLDAILAEPGLDAIHIGPKDLWQSMGMPAQAAVDEAVAEITRRTFAAGKVVSLQFRVAADLPDRLGAHVERGARMITVSPLDFIRNAAPEFLARVRG